MSSAFDSAWQYVNTFEPYRQFYQENEMLDLEALKQEEHGKYCGTLSVGQYLTNWTALYRFGSILIIGIISHLFIQYRIQSHKLVGLLLIEIFLYSEDVVF